MRAKRRKGVSEIMGTLLLIAITLVAAFAVFGWLNGQVAVSAGQYSSHINANMNYLDEKETIPFAYFPDSQTLKVWVDNVGPMAMVRYSLIITGPLCPTSNIQCNNPTATPTQVTITWTQGGSCTVSSGSCSVVPNPPTTSTLIASGTLASFTVSLSGPFGFQSTQDQTAAFVIQVVGQFGTAAQDLVTR